jgi:muramidase (phage lysozyme)
MSIKAAYLIPHLALRESNVRLDEATQNHAYALLLHDAIERPNKAVKCVSAARHECATAA